jgi:drug/metabolite transporter (DMT)-like permease
VKPAPRALYALILLMTTIWGANYVVAKTALHHFPALLIGPLRAALAAALLAPAWLVVRWRRGGEDAWTARELSYLGLLGVFGITLNQILFILGMARTSVAHAALIIATTPLQVMALAALRGQERITPRKAAGMLTAVAGVGILHMGDAAGRGASLAGDLLVFLAAFCFSLYTVFSKEVTRRHDSLTVNALGYVAGALAGAPLLIGQSRGFDYGSVSAGGWLALAYMTLLASILCYLIFYYALDHMPASRLAAFSYLQPVIAAATGFVFLHEPVTLPVAAGGALVLGGVWVTGRG